MPSTPDIIDFCVKVADKSTKRYKVVPSHYYLCTDGKFRSVRGIPFGVAIVQPEQKETSYVYWDDHNSTTFAMKKYLSEKDALDAQETRIAKNMQEFRDVLATEDDLQPQFIYWSGVADKHGIPKIS